ncbi:MAG: S49 family peptidase [Rhodospirillaceae bacterium]
MSLLDLPHLGGLVFGTPLMIARPKLDTILQVLSLRLQGNGSDTGVSSDQAFPVTANGIAVIPVLGTLANRTFGLAAMSGLASYVRLGEQLDLAAADPQVKGILLDLDSNGGQAGGVFDLADRVLALRGVKPVYAIADEACLSAAYALACGAERLYVTQTGAVGSIGVVALHADQSGADEKAGVRYDTITAGDRKTDGNPHAPLSDEARAALQAEVDRLYGLFVGRVASARGLSEAQVRDQQAGVFFGGNAVAAGLADQVGTFASALNDLSSRLASRRGGVTMLSAQKGPTAMSDTPPVGATAPATNPPAAPETTLREQLAAEITAKISGPGAEDPQALATRLRAEAAEILDLCQLAGQPGLAAGFIRQGLSPAAVRKALLTGRAEQFEAAPTVPLTPGAVVNESPLIAAIKATYRREN